MHYKIKMCFVFRNKIQRVDKRFRVDFFPTCMQSNLEPLCAWWDHPRCPFDGRQIFEATRASLGWRRAGRDQCRLHGDGEVRGKKDLTTGFPMSKMGWGGV